MNDWVDAPVELSEAVIGAAMEVHSTLGPGLLESIYKRALLVELTQRGIKAESEVEVACWYKGINLGNALRADLVVENRLIVEAKCVAAILPIHRAQLMTYLRLMRYRRGLLFNFHAKKLKDDMHRVSQ